MKDEPTGNTGELGGQPQQGTAWSDSTIHDFVCRHPDPRHPLTLTITGDEDEIRQHLSGPRLRCLISDIDEALRQKLKHGHSFKDANAAMEWVRQELGEARE